MKTDDERREYFREYYRNNKEKYDNKEYREKNKDKKLEYQREYRKKNKDKLREKEYQYGKKYYEEHKEEISKKAKDYQKQYREKNKDKKREYTNKYNSEPFNRLKHNIRTMISNSFRYANVKKKFKAVEILGCTFEQFKEHIESQFTPFMTWENRGLYNGQPDYGWDIDHIIPISTAQTEADLIKLNHYTNLRPLCSYINRVVKGSKID